MLVETNRAQDLSAHVLGKKTVRWSSYTRCTYPCTKDAASRAADMSSTANDERSRMAEPCGQVAGTSGVPLCSRHIPARRRNTHGSLTQSTKLSSGTVAPPTSRHRASSPPGRQDGGRPAAWCSCHPHRRGARGRSAASPQPWSPHHPPAAVCAKGAGEVLSRCGPKCNTALSQLPQPA